MTSPTQRSLAELRRRGWTCQVVERWNAYAKVRVDLFGCIDVVACTPEGLLGVQATSGDNVAHRLEKSKALPGLRSWLASGGLFEVWGWRKGGPRGKRKVWTLRVVRVTLEDLQDG